MERRPFNEQRAEAPRHTDQDVRNAIGVMRMALDDMAAKHISETSEILKNQLDNLLLFAALFSAINSAFLVYTLPVISSSAQNTTNALLLYVIQGVNNESFDAASRLLASAEEDGLKVSVTINQMFATSLMLSIIVTLLAVLGQTWVTKFGRAVETDHVEVLYERQRKILGAERWYFQPVIEILLPVMLQLALIVFCIGFVMLLWSIDPGLAIPVLPFLAFGLAGIAGSTAFAIWDPDCPFKTPLSSTLLPKLLSGVYWVWHQATTFNYHTQPDVYERKRDRLARLFRRKPYQGTVEIDAACWFVVNAREERFVRGASIHFLILQDSALVAHVGAAQRAMRRLWKLIERADGDIEAGPSGLQSRNSSQSGLDVAVVSHIFLGTINVDTTWYDRLSNVYISDASTLSPVYMAAIFKILMSTDAKEDRNTILRDRLYSSVAESGCSAKVVSLTGFAMQYLPRRRSGARKPSSPTLMARGSRGVSALLRMGGVVGAWASGERSNLTPSASPARVTATSQSIEYKDIHNQLWHLYMSDDLDTHCRNIVGAMQTYTQQRASQSPSPSLPTGEQFMAFLQRVGELVEVHQLAKTSPMYRKFFGEACGGLLQSLKTSRADEQSDGHPLYQETHSLLLQSIDQITRDMADDMQELIAVSEWCPQLVKLHIDIQGDGEILHRAYDIMRLCRLALNDQGLSYVEELGRAFVPSVVAMGHLLMASGPVHPEAGPECEAFIGEAVGLIGAMTDVLFPGHLRIAFLSQEAITAMHYFMEVSKANYTLLTDHQIQFMQQYGQLLREIGAEQWMPLEDKRRELMEEISVGVGEDGIHQPEGGV